MNNRKRLVAFRRARGAPPPLSTPARHPRRGTLRSSQEPQALCLLFLLFSLACNPSQVAEPGRAKTRLSIATGGTGGVYYPYGGGIAKIISANLPNVEATAEVTAAPVDSLKFLRDGKADIAFTLADTLADAVNGRDGFEGGRVELRALAVLYTNYTQVVALASSRIRNLSDLRGKVVSTGSPGSGTEVIAFRLLDAAGLNPSADIRAQSLGVAQSTDALRDGKIDAFFWSGALPTAAILDLAHTPGIAIEMLPSDSLAPALQKKYGESLYTLEKIPRISYPDLRDDVPVVAVANVLVVHQRMSDQLAYDITRTLFEHQPELGAIHPEAKKLTLTSATDGSPAPFHPGSIRYYREQHVWKE